jgi:hypothetical protein
MDYPNHQLPDEVKRNLAKFLTEEAEMNFLSRVVIMGTFIASFTSVAHAAIYNVDKLTNVYADANGRVLIKWSGSPNPGPCGPNNGWVTIRSTANEALKTLAYTTYFSGKPARIDTNDCDGNNEAVGSLYSPGG